MFPTVRVMVIGVSAMVSTWAWAAIPEPDAVLYGPALVNGVEVQQRSAVVLVARLAGGQEIGRFDFSDCNGDGVRDACELSCAAPGCSGVPGCGTALDTSPADGRLDDCPGDLYVLRVRCESVPDGLSPTGSAAVLNPADPDVVSLFMAVSGGPEKFVRHLVINQRGKIRTVALSALDLLAFRNFQRCQNGPIHTSVPVGCDGETAAAAADYDEDSDADLRDFAFIQNHFVGN